MLFQIVLFGDNCRLTFRFKKQVKKIPYSWGGRREEGSEWGTHVYLWRIHFDIWQN